MSLVNKHQKVFDSLSHLFSILFCLFANSQSVIDISDDIRSAAGNLNHLGVLKVSSKFALSY